MLFNTVSPEITYINYSYNGTDYDFEFSVKNKDSVSAEIFAGANSTPTLSRGVIATNEQCNSSFI